MIYLDSAALVKLIRKEAESEALVTWLNDRVNQPLVASVLVEVEVPGPCAAVSPAYLLESPRFSLAFTGSR